MDDFDSDSDSDFDTFEFDKTTANRSYRRLQSLARLLRFVELFASLVLLTWLSARAPLAVKVSGYYFRRLSAAVTSPLFVFFIGNAIVVALFAKSGHLAPPVERANAGNQISEKSSSNVSTGAQDSPREEIVFQDKEIICEDLPEVKVSEEDATEKNLKPRFPDPEPGDLQTYRRTESDIIARGNCEENKEAAHNGILRRSEADVLRKVTDVGKSEYSEDGMSNDEFRRTIEDFIAKQVKFIREESNSVFVQN